ncbi:cation/H+ exchanger [Ephemerocybe angulata]|uniref:Cation/H+ exchanger n=1 Tax=Ephemerocybe angulata TaxID=980116 RepID=A0A8H6HNH0_9AGAR|nr:cation/H+ exchanger [Tulosesus angulatus]
MGEFSKQLEQVAVLLARAGEGAAEQGGILSGENPVHYSAADPFRLWVIQVVIIIGFTQILALGLGKIRQPRVIAEVIGGVLLGPTAMGRIPHFSSTIFPDAAMPLLSLTSTIGLILFLFLVGLEIDTRMIKRNVKASFTVSVAGLLIPLGLGAALGVGVYNEFIDKSVNFGHFLLFTAVAIGITAFPVLCRILTELKLLDTQVGVVVLSAGVGNDVIGWILLALTVALVNSSAGLTALWVLLVCAGYCIFLLYPVRWGFVWLARRTGSLEQGAPTTFMMTVTLLVVFISAFFTDIIGVHAIFGGFLAGLIVPHDNGFAISLVEKIEDLVSILFLPLYFTLSGLRTNLGLLNDGKAWGYTILICVVAFSSKFFSCGLAALAFGFNWREAGAIGSLMSCKGLVELIVLNIGLQAGVLNAKTFSMFVVHALILTFITTPLTLLFYPSKYRSISGAPPKADRSDTEGKGHAEGKSPHPDSDDLMSRFALVLEKVEELPAAMTLSQLLQPNVNSSTPTLVESTTSATQIAEVLAPAEGGGTPMIPPPQAPRKITVDAIRLMELTHRASAVFRSQEAEALMYNDPVISVYRAFGQLNQLAVSASLSIVSYDDFADVISEHVVNSDTEMLLIPWSRGPTTLLTPPDAPLSPSAAAQSTSAMPGSYGGGRQGRSNPFDGVFHKTTTLDQTDSVVHSEFIRSVFLRCPCEVALFVERGTAVSARSLAPGQRLFLPFFGGPDDRLALKFLVQLCAREGVEARVVYVRKGDLEGGDSRDSEVEGKEGALSPPMSPAMNHLTVAAADTVYGAYNTQTRLSSDTADNLLWEKYTNAEQVSTLPPHARAALSRMTFTAETTPKPLHRVTELVEAEATRVSEAGGRTLVVLAGRSRRMAVESLAAELREIMSRPTQAGAGAGARMGSSVPKTLGDVGAALVARHLEASLLVVQAASASSAD